MTQTDRINRQSSPKDTLHTRRSPARQGANPSLNASPAISSFQSGSASSHLQLKRDAPETYTPSEVLTLQRSMGNQAVQGLLRPQSAQSVQSGAPSAKSNLIVQTKLTVGPAKDRYEDEADQIANQVMRSPDTAASAKQSAPVAKRIQRMSGAEGGNVDSATESAIQSARSGGSKLDDGLRSRMEGNFGADFSGVRIHADQQADTLNRSLNARAFTTGNDIFFKQGEYRPESGSGQKLLAHELTHVVQQNGTGNVQRKSGVIQRAVGFEFEVGNWQLQKLNAPPTPAQKNGTEEIPATALATGNDVLGKESKIYQGKNYAMMADIGDDTHIEFVTHPPFQETSNGRSTLVKTMKEIHSFCKILIAARSKANIQLEGSSTEKMLASDLPLTKRKILEPNVLITPRTTIDGEPQMTAGIRLSQLANVMQKMTPGKLNGEDDSEAEQRNIGLQYMSGKQMRDAKLVGQAPSESVPAIKYVVENMTFTERDDEGNVKDVPMPEPSMQLLSMIALIRTYLVSASGNIAYAKSLAPLMARTHFGEIFRHLTPDEKEFWPGYPNTWVNMIMSACGMDGEEDQPIFSGTSQYVSGVDYAKLAAGLTRKEWLRGMLDGKDLLTEKNFPDADVDHLLFGLGGLRKKTDTVGKKRRGNKSTLTSAPIFEFRRMQGRKNFELWPTLAEELFDYIMGINDFKNSTFSGARTEARDKKLAKKKK